MLDAYRRHRRAEASLYVEVKLAGKGKRSKWKSGRHQRLDAIVARPAGAPGIHRRQEFFDRLREGPPVESIELIEVKVVVTEEAIGEAVANLVLWKGQYDIAIDRSVVLSCVADDAMRWVCERLGIDVELEPIELEKDPSKVSHRRAYTFDEARLRRLDPYRRRAGGTYVTKIPLAGPDSGVHGWDDAQPVYLNLLRIPDGPIDALVLYDTPDRLFSLIGDHPIEIVEVRKELKRGSIGKVLAHALMFEAQYELPVARKVIVCEEGDEALEWACQKLGIVVEKA